MWQLRDESAHTIGGAVRAAHVGLGWTARGFALRQPALHRSARRQGRRRC